MPLVWPWIALMIFQAFLHGSAEVAGTGDQVRLVRGKYGLTRIVRSFLYKLLHNFRIVIHAPQQHALVSQGDAVVGHQFARAGGFGRDLARNG